MKKIIFHIDINCFFARCEEIKDPSLEDIPFVVAERAKRSVVCTSNLKARKFNIKAGMKLDEAFKILPTLRVVKINHKYYEQKSNEFLIAIYNLLKCDIEIASIDECYIDVTQISKNYHNNVDILATMLKKHILKETKLHVTIGIGNTKFLAKMAGDLKPKNGIGHIYDYEIETKLWPLEIQKMILVGKETKKIFDSLDIKTIKDFVDFKDKELLKEKLNKRFYTMSDFVYGRSDDSIDTTRNIPKSISSGLTFEVNTDDKVQILETITTLCKQIFLRINEEGLYPITLSVSIKKTYEETITKSHTYHNYILNEKSLYQKSLSIFNHIWEKEPIRSISISTSNLKPLNSVYEQHKLFKL